MKFRCVSCQAFLDGLPQDCPKCGRAINYPYSTKSRGTYIILGIFLGAVGVHNFYAGHYSRGAIQVVLAITVFGAILSAAWAIVDVCAVDKDGNGLRLAL